MNSNSNNRSVAVPPQAIGPFAPAVEYLVDAAQRRVLFWDVMRPPRQPIPSSTGRGSRRTC